MNVQIWSGVPLAGLMKSAARPSACALFSTPLTAS